VESGAFAFDSFSGGDPRPQGQTMIKELFLSCALALQPVSFKNPSFLKSFEMLMEFLHVVHPTSEFVLATEEVFIDGYFKTPLLWKGMHIYERPATLKNERQKRRNQGKRNGRRKPTQSA
jgi:hypothetical protein